MIRYTEYLILIFFVYSFSGWFMESFGGIFKEKKFINRGFLIGPYCPVYGVGVVGIAVALGKYQNDVPALFILSIVLCGSLEYFTSFIMEKLFNARWWDYHNKKFNINGRICLETLIPFGIVGTSTICIINPKLYSLFDKIPDFTLNTISIVLSILFVIDFIISFCIIASFKNLTYTKRDNTEEISNKVKEKTEEINEAVLEKAEDTFMKMESNAIHMSRNLKVRRLKLERKVRFTRKNIQLKTTKPLRELSVGLKNRKDIILKSIIDNKEKINDQIKTSQKVITSQIIETFKKRSILSKRLMEAFPRISIRGFKDKDNNNLQK